MGKEYTGIQLESGNLSSTILLVSPRLLSKLLGPCSPWVLLPHSLELGWGRRPLSIRT